MSAELRVIVRIFDHFRIFVFLFLTFLRITFKGDHRRILVNGNRTFKIGRYRTIANEKYDTEGQLPKINLQEFVVKRCVSRVSTFIFTRNIAGRKRIFPRFRQTSDNVISNR